MSWGEALLLLRGQAERRRQPKVPHDRKKFAFQMATKDQTTPRCFWSSSYSEGPVQCRSGREAKVEQEDPEQD